MAQYQEGASEEDISALAKFKFQRTNHSLEKGSGEKPGALAGVMSLVGSSDCVTDRAISGEDAVSSKRVAISFCKQHYCLSHYQGGNMYMHTHVSPTEMLKPCGGCYLCRNVASAYHHMMMGLNCGRSLAHIIFIVPVLTNGCG